MAKAIAGNQKTYVDDTRPIGHNEDNCNALIHQIETGMAYYGLPEATQNQQCKDKAIGRGVEASPSRALACLHRL